MSDRLTDEVLGPVSFRVVGIDDGARVNTPAVLVSLAPEYVLARWEKHPGDERIALFRRPDGRLVHSNGDDPLRLTPAPDDLTLASVVIPETPGVAGKADAKVADETAKEEDKNGR